MEIIEMVQEKVHDIENMIRDVVFLQHRNELTVSELAQEMKDFKDEMKDFKDEMKDFKDEMKDFKDEMKDFKDEMKDFKDEMKDFKDEMGDFKDEMKDFKDEMGDFKDENLKESRKMNKQWGALANKMGTIVEDLVSPAIQPLVQRYFGVEPIEMGIRIKRKRESLQIELDAVAITDEKVFVFEVKSSPQIDYVRYFVDHQIPLFKELFKEQGGKQIIPIFASISMDKKIIAECTRLGVYAMAYREWDYMDLLNFEDLTPQGA